MSAKFLTKIIWMMLLGFAAAAAQENPRIDKLLKEVDSWVTTDTAKIMKYIDSTKNVTMETLKSSKYWEPVQTELDFLLGIDLIVSPQIDNTGRIYFRMRLTGENDALFYVDLPGGWPIQITPNNWNEEGLTISGYKVHPSGAYVLVRVQKNGDEMHDIWYFSRTGEFKPLLVSRERRYSGIIFDDKNPDRFFLYIQELRQMQLASYTISTGKLDTLYTEPGAYYPTDYHDGKLIIVRSFSFSQNQLALLDLSTRKVTDLSDTSLFNTADFTSDGKILTLTSAESEPEEFTKFCLLDPARPKKFKMIYDPKAEIDDFYFIRSKGIGVTSMNQDGYSKLAAFDLQGRSVSVPAVDIGVISEPEGSAIWANDLGDVVFSFSSPKTPPTAFKFRLGDNALQQIGEVSTFGANFYDVTVEVIHYKSEDGTEIPALLYLPAKAKKDGSNPAIITYHGGPPQQSRPYFQRNFAFALSKGFILMLPNVRGSSGYGPAYERADNQEGRLVALKDAERAIDYLIEEGWSNPNKIAIWGGSYGGYTVNWLATQASDKIACVVSQVGVSDIEHMFAHTKNQNFIAGYEKEYGKRGSDLLHTLSPIYSADKVTKPIFFKTGFNDPRVPPSDSRRFAYVLSKLGKPVWLYEETESGHGGVTKAQTIFDLTSSYVFTMLHLMKQI